MNRVICANCGFLNWNVSHVFDERGETIRTAEIEEYWRKRISGGGQFDGNSQEDDEDYTISCLRRQWIFSKSVPNDKDIRYSDAKLLGIPRECPYFLKYEPGFSPEEHKERQNQAENRKATFRATIIGAVIGFLAAIAAQLVYAIVIGG